MSLDKQIMLFKETVEEYLPQHFKNTAEISQYVLDSVFAILIGSNDYLGNYLNKKYNNATGRYNGDEFANLLISNLEKQLKVCRSSSALYKKAVSDFKNTELYVLNNNVVLKLEKKRKNLKYMAKQGMLFYFEILKDNHISNV